jgi:DNA end-binding protein Ku
MPQRALWNGFLKLSLVSCPIALFAATAAEKRLSFRRVNRATGNALRQQLIDTVTGENVAGAEIGRGYEVSADRFLVVEDEELQTAREEASGRPFSAGAVKQTPGPAATGRAAERNHIRPPDEEERPRSRSSKAAGDGAADHAILEDPLPVTRPINDKTIDLDRFVDRQDLDIRFIDSPYYIVSRDETGEEAFAVIREAMRGRGMAGMGRVILQKRERPIVVVPFDRGLVGLTLRFSHELREPVDFFETIPDIDLPDDMVEMAALLIDRKTGRFDSAFLEDRYRTLLVQRLQQESGAKSTEGRPSLPREQNVIDLMAALRRSIGREQAGGRRATPPPRAAAARAKGPATRKSRDRRR